MTATDPAIYIGDTVHTIRKDGTEGRARWQISDIYPETNKVEIERCVRTSYTGHTYTSREFRADRIILVRHGNADDDNVRGLGIEVRARTDRTTNPYVLDGRAHHPTAV